jgi:hypothetical protein
VISIAGRSARAAVALAMAIAALPPVFAQGQQTPPPPPVPVPRPFPGAGAPPPATGRPADPQTTTSAAAPAPSAGACGSTPTETALGVRVPPTATYLDGYDAGRGQCIYLYGTNDAYLDVVQYFRSSLRGGRELFREPPMQQFDLGSFDGRTMTLQPSVVVKDHTWNGSEGYPFVKGTTLTRYKTVIQIVPPR